MLHGKQEVITSRVLKFYGIGEAELEHRIQSILEKQTNPTVAPLATADAVTLRITAKAQTTDAALKLIAPMEEEIRSLVGDYIYGTDDDTLSSKAAELLIRNGWTIAAAESLTAGYSWQNWPVNQGSVRHLKVALSSTMRSESGTTWY